MNTKDKFTEEFFNFMNRDYVQKIGMIEGFAKQEKTSSAIILFKFIAFNYDLFLKGKECFGEKESLWN
jgi:hypothetical protein|tara:strand:+ start:218 stop:421 length:204 start_codon:yes stop_codon:yes gene_type:complete